MAVHADLFANEGSFAPRPAWQVIEAARRQLLTGELTLATTPATHVYLRDGQVYFAERSTDGGLGVRLLVEGIITRQQIGKGALLVSGVEHLGRMFQRDTSIDRQSVELCVELMTDETLTSVANDVIPHYVMTMYKRHPSGIDRWLPHRVEVTTRIVEGSHLADPDAPIRTGDDPGWRTVAAAAPVPAEVTSRSPFAGLVLPGETHAVALGDWQPMTAPQLLGDNPTVAEPPPSIASSLAAAAAAGMLDSTAPLTTAPLTTTPLTTEAIFAESQAGDSGISLAQSAVDAIMSTAIADEVAEAVRRALTAIDAASKPLPSLWPSDFSEQNVAVASS